MTLTIIAGIIGIAGTLAAWFLNPKRIIYSQLDSAYLKLEELYAKRDKALAANDSDTLTVVTADIVRMCRTKNVLLQRLG